MLVQHSNSLYGLGLCSSGVGGLWYVAGLGNLWLQFGCGVSGEDVLLDWADVFPSPAVSLALGLDLVTAWGWGSVSDGSWDVWTLISWGQEEYFLAGIKLWQGFCIVGLVEILLLCLHSHDQVILDCFHIDRGWWSTWAFYGSIVQNFPRQRHLWADGGTAGLVGDLYRDVLASWLVLRVVLSIWTCCSMKPLDWWKWGDDVVYLMCWCWRNHWCKFYWGSTLFD